jgi:NADH:ubiquinone reductase (H+-translocating)
MTAIQQRNLIAGAIAGLVGGLVSGLALYAQHASFESPFGVPSGAIALVLYVLFATLFGAAFGLMIRHQPLGYAATVSSGLLYGLLGWILIPLTLAPLAAGQLPLWSAQEASAAFPALVGYLLYGGVTGLGFYLFVTLYGRRYPQPELREAPAKQRVVILGGGFAGVAAAQELEKLLTHETDVEIVLVSESNFLLFTPMLAGVAAGSLEAQHIGAPVRAALSWAKFIRARVEAVDAQAKTVWVQTTPSAPPVLLTFDHLVLALGSMPSYRGIPGAKEMTFPFKTLGDAARLRNHVIALLERADAEEDAEERKQLLTFVTVGGGYSGVEVIAELVDLTRSVLRYYPHIPAEEPRFVLVHSRDRLLPTISESLAQYALSKLEARGIECVLDMHVKSVTGDSVILKDGREVFTHTVVWTAGNKPHPLLASLPGERSRAGALITDEILRAKGLQDVWAVGDCAHIPNPSSGDPYPATAQHAAREGKQVAKNIAAALRGHAPEPFRFQALGTLVPIGRRSAVAEIRGLKFSGFLAWLMWRTVYLTKLPTLEKKVRVTFDWLIDLFFQRDIVLTTEPSVQAPETGRANKSLGEKESTVKGGPS